MWHYVINKLNNFKFIREFVGDLMNVSIDYENYIERENTCDRISGVSSDENNILTTTQKKLSDRTSVMMKVVIKSDLFPSNVGLF